MITVHYIKHRHKIYIHSRYKHKGVGLQKMNHLEWTERVISPLMSAHTVVFHRGNSIHGHVLILFYI